MNLYGASFFCFNNIGLKHSTKCGVSHMVNMNGSHMFVLLTLLPHLPVNY